MSADIDFRLTVVVVSIFVLVVSGGCKPGLGIALSSGKF